MRTQGGMSYIIQESLKTLLLDNSRIRKGRDEEEKVVVVVPEEEEEEEEVQRTSSRSSRRIGEIFKLNWFSSANATDFPDKNLYFESSLRLTTALNLLAHLDPPERLVLGPVKLYKDTDFFAHEFIVAQFDDREVEGINHRDRAQCRVERTWAVNTDDIPAEGNSSSAKAPQTRPQFKFAGLSSSSSSSLRSSVSGSSSSWSSKRSPTVCDDSCFIARHASSIHSSSGTEMPLVATYNPPYDGPPVDAMRFLVLMSTIKKVSPDYRLLDSNCYYFVLMAIELMKAEFGGAVTPAVKGKYPLGKVAGKYPLADITEEGVKEKVEKARKIFAEDWEVFVNTRDKARRQIQEAERKAEQEAVRRKKSEKKAEDEAALRKKAEDEAVNLRQKIALLLAEKMGRSEGNNATI